MKQFIHYFLPSLKVVLHRLLLIFLFLNLATTLIDQFKEILLDNAELLYVDDGLSSRMITCLYEDSEGFIWVGTSLGVNRYDGHQFRQYSKKLVSVIIEDKNKWLWLLPKSYYAAYFVSEIEIINPITGEKKTVKDLDPNGLLFDKKIVDFRQDAANNLWFCTKKDKVYKYDGLELILVNSYNAEKPINGILPISENELIF